MLALFSGRFTVAVTPGSLPRPRSMRVTHEAHVIPATARSTDRGSCAGGASSNGVAVIVAQSFSSSRRVRKRIRKGGARPAGYCSPRHQLVARLLDRGSHALDRQHGVAVHDDPPGRDVDRDLTHALDAGDRAVHRLCAVLAGHTGNGVHGLGHGGPFLSVEPGMNNPLHW